VRYACIGLVAVLLATAIQGFAQQPTANASAVALSGSVSPPAEVPRSRLFFPHNWVRGHTDFEVAPSHNEPDLGRCSQAPAAEFGGVNSTCTAYARYILSGYVELQPIGRTVLRHIFLFYTPQFFFGRNVPQYSYTASFEPLADERSMGLGIKLPKNFEVRLTSHRVDWLGRYASYLGPADLGNKGPYGNSATVGLRWSFGGWGQSQAPEY
jgi:hypothetical protein